MPHEPKREILVRVPGGDPCTADPKRLRVHVTFYGVTAALIEELSRSSSASAAKVVRRLVDDAVRRRTVYPVGE